MSEAEPPRPPTVPEAAPWVPEQDAFRLCDLVDGELHGEARFYRADGTLREVSHYLNGREHGPYERYHPDGSWSQRGQYFADKAHGPVAWHRPASGPSPEPTVPDVCPPSVVEMRTIFEHGVPWPIKFYDADGNEVHHTGAAIPPRPEGIEPAANYDPDDRRWYLGLGSQGLEQRHGTWRWWDEAGALLLEMRYHRGREIEEVSYDPPGTKRIHRIKGRNRTVLLEERFDDAGQPVDADGAPIGDERPAGVPAGARFDTASGGWVHGPEPTEVGPSGRYAGWTRAGVPDRELLYDGGKRFAERKHRDDGTLMRESRYDAEDREVSEMWWYGDGDLRSRIERTFDAEGLVASRIWVYGTGEKASAVRDGGNVRWTFRDPDGATIAEGCLDSDKNTVGTWTFTEDGRSWSLDLTEARLQARVDEDYDPMWLLGRALLPGDGEGRGRRSSPGSTRVLGGRGGPSTTTWRKFQGHAGADLAGGRGAADGDVRTSLRDRAPELDLLGVSAGPFHLLALLEHPQGDRSAARHGLDAGGPGGAVAEDDSDGGDGDGDIGEDDETVEADEDDDDDDDDEEDEDEDDDDDDDDDGGENVYTIAAGSSAPSRRFPHRQLSRRAARAWSSPSPAAGGAARHDLCAPRRTAPTPTSSPSPSTAWWPTRRSPRPRSSPPAAAPPDPLVRLTAALAAAERLRDASRQVVDRPRQRIDADPALRSRFAGLPFTEGTVIAYRRAAHLASVGTPRPALAGAQLPLDGMDLFTLDSVRSASCRCASATASRLRARLRRRARADVTTAAASRLRLLEQRAAVETLPGDQPLRALAARLRAAPDPADAPGDAGEAIRRQRRPAATAP
ncbi:MAG: hypothetical protein R3F59_00650 [Myxococcota bacterium]